MVRIGRVIRAISIVTLTCGPDRKTRPSLDSKRLGTGRKPNVTETVSGQLQD